MWPLYGSRRVKLSYTFCLLLSIFCGVVSAQSQPDGTWQTKIAPGLFDRVAEQQSVDIIILFNQKADLSGAEEMSWLERGRFVHQRLLETADACQAEVIALLSQSPGAFQAYRRHISLNAVSIEGLSDTGLLEALAQSIQVKQIQPLGEKSLIEPMESAPATDDTTGLTWGIKDIRASELWDQGITGQGIVVGSIDSGVHYTHDTLVNQYRGNIGNGQFNHNYNWWDPRDGTQAPYDTNPTHSHGTHTTGTAVGGDGVHHIGVAPGAKWIACAGCQGGSCSDQDLLTCMDFMLAPWALDGQGPADGNPDQRPHVVSNSWGGGGCVDIYEAAVLNWRAAGIFPSFSVGNSGPECESVGQPGGYESAVSTGAYDAFGKIAWFSSRGPSCKGTQIKPEVAAPGVTTLSASSANDQAYRYLGGTSMASPHTTGLVALLWSARPGLVGNIDQTVQAIEDGARPVVDVSCDQVMSGVGTSGIPNNVYGYGKIDAVAALATTQTETALEPSFQRRIGKNGQAFEYTLTIKNNTDADQDFTLSLGDHVWTATLSTDRLTVASNSRATFLVTHQVPDSPFIDEESIIVQADWSGGVLEAQVSSRTMTRPSCTCPRKRNELLSESFEGDVPPAGWEIKNNDGHAQNGWQRNDKLDDTGNLTGGSGFCAVAASREWYYPMDTELKLPVIDLTAIPAGQKVYLEYKTYVSTSWNHSEQNLVEISTDQGITWQTVKQYDQDVSASLERIDLGDVAGTTLLIRFHYVSPEQAWYWEVDDVVVYTCRNPESGLVICPESGVGCPGVNELQAMIYNFNQTGELYRLAYESTEGFLTGPDRIGPVEPGDATDFSLDFSLPYNIDGRKVLGRVKATGMETGVETIGKLTYQSGGWVEGKKMPFKAFDNPAVVYKDKIYVFGGSGSGGQVGIYDPATDDWTTGATLQDSVIESPGCGVFGYNDRSEATFTMFPGTYSYKNLNAYNLDTNTWSTPDPPVDLYYLKNDGRFCVSDPENNVGYLLGAWGAGVYRYHPDTNTVDTLADLPDQRTYAAAWLYDGRLCIAGGQDDYTATGQQPLSSTHCLDLTTNTWGEANADLPALPYTWWGMAYGLYNGAPLIQGGRSGTHETGAALLYDSEKQQWKTLPSAPKPFRQSGSTAYNGRFYVFGGGLPDHGAYNDVQIMMDCTASPDLITVSGQILYGGSALSGVQIKGLPEAVITDGEGRFETQVPYGWTGTIRPTLKGHTFIPAERTYDSLNYEAISQDFSADMATGGGGGGGGGCFIRSSSGD